MDKIDTIIYSCLDSDRIIKMELSGYIISSKPLILCSNYTLNLDATGFWLKIIKDNSFPKTSFNFNSKKIPMLQCLGFAVFVGNYLGASSQYEIFKKYSEIGKRSKLEYISLQTDLMEAGLPEVAVFDNTFINEIDAIFKFSRN